MYKYYNLLFLKIYENKKNKIKNLKNWNILVFNGKKKSIEILKVVVSELKKG